jgi:hypothetical protein
MEKSTETQKFLDKDLTRLASPGNNPLSRMLMKELEKNEQRHDSAVVIQRVYRLRKSSQQPQKSSGLFSYFWI